MSKVSRKIISWNVNGIRAAERKGFMQWIARAKPDVLGLQETRIDDLILPERLRVLDGYHAVWSFAQKKGYSGTALYTREKPVKTYAAIGDDAYDHEGRMTAAELSDVIICNAYFPKGSGTLRDNSRVPFKLGFYRAFFDWALLLAKRRKKPLVVMGDFNTAHENIDLKNWKTNSGTSGFLPEERAEMTKQLERGFADTFRRLHPSVARYSWWSQRMGARARNIGWRIDYVWVSEKLMPRVKEAFIDVEVLGSDHCPVGIVLG
ncbi:MAG: exodeoxyribonuclease III [Deltaproteobacteria bacterium]|nr:exodeoxyribonuclease III [Deltaproteobacteria bacterium]